MSGPGGAPAPLDVAGGAAGISVQVEELQAAAAALDRVGIGLGELTARAGAVAADPRLLLTGVLAPATLASVEARFAVALLGSTGAVPTGLRVALLALRLRASAAAYTATEARVLVLVTELEAGLRGRPGELAAALTDLVAGAVPGGGPAVARMLGTAGRVSPLLAEDAAVRVSASAPVPVAPPAGVAGLLGRVAAAEATPGTLTVDEVTRPDGARAWVVAIPGTQDWSPLPTDDPLDGTGDVAALAGRPSAAATAVVRALEAAGVRPGEPVLLAGHSLGGMLAARLAADPAVRARFTVTCVVTAGSPVARYAVPDAVAVLSLEHSDDVVPALDGAENPDRQSWVTVRRPSDVQGPRAGPHDVLSYVATAGAVDASTDVSLTAWRTALAPFVAGTGVHARRTVVRMRRAGGERTRGEPDPPAGSRAAPTPHGAAVVPRGRPPGRPAGGRPPS